MTTTSETAPTPGPLSLQHKIDFAVVYRVRGANPNGDPLNGNEPRTFGDESLGLQSDVSLKRKMRDRLMEAGQPIYVQSDDRRSDDARSLRERLEHPVHGINLAQPAEAVRRDACAKWFDVRAFGQLIALKGKAKAAAKPKARARGGAAEPPAQELGADGDAEGGDSGVSIGIRGPVSVHPALSLKPVQIASLQITKSVNSEGDGSGRGADTMGMKHVVEDGIYVFYGAISPQLAERTGFSDADAQAFKGVLPRLFENDASSARPEGSMEVLNVVWWEHASKGGAMSSAKVHRSLKVNPDTGEVTAVPLDGVEICVCPGF